MRELAWFRADIDPVSLQPLGFRSGGGGAHQAMTMMLRELTQLLASAGDDTASIRRVIVDENMLGKSTAAAKASAFRHLRNLYGVAARSIVADTLKALWIVDVESRPLLALLCALARDPLLRDSAEIVLGAPTGEPVGANEIAKHLAVTHRGRFTMGMVAGISRNCASSWTQSGHLTGRTNKRRTHPRTTPVAAAYGALLGSLAGFGGPALIASPWMEVLDVSTNERLSLLRRAEGLGLLRVRAAGDVVELVIEPLLAQAATIRQREAAGV